MEDNLHEIVRRVKIATLEELGKTIEERSIWLLKVGLLISFVVAFDTITSLFTFL